MKWSSIFQVLITIIIITGCGVIIIVIKGFPPVGPDPDTCTVCGPLKAIGAAQILVALASLFAMNKLKNEFKNDRLK